MATKNSIGSNIPIEVAKGGSNATSFANSNGTVIWDGTKLATISPGTAAQVLTSNGIGMAPSYQPASGGGSSGRTLLQTATASNSASLIINTGFGGPYKYYQLEMLNLIPVTNNINFQIQCSTDGGSTYDSSAIYWYFFVYVNDQRMTVTANNNDTTMKFTTNTSNLTVSAFNMFLILYDLDSSSKYKSMVGDGSNFESVDVNYPSAYLYGAGGYNNSSSAVNAFKLTASSGNISSGTLRFFGVS